MARRQPYDDWVDIYDAWVETAPVARENQPFYVDLLCQADGPAVELGVGFGRIALEAAGRGKEVIGVDSSQGMIDVFRQRAREQGVEDLVTALHADARKFQIPDPAALVVFPFHSLGHLVKLSDKRALFRHVHDVLRPGGLFVFDMFVFDPEYARRWSDVSRLRAEYVDWESERDALLWVTTRYDVPNQKIRVLAASEVLDERGNVFRRKVRRVDFSWLDVDQARKLLSQTGFEVEALYGGFDRSPFTESSTEHVWVARKPAAA